MIKGNTPFPPGEWGAYLLLGLVLLCVMFLLLGRCRRTAVERRSVLTALRREKERAEVTLSSINDTVIRTDAGGAVEYLNPSAEDLLGWSMEAARGRPLAEVLKLVDENTGAAVVIPDPAQMGEGRLAKGGQMVRLTRRDGESLAVDESAAMIRDRRGHASGSVIVIRDVSMEHHLTRQLLHQASHDALTGLMNRREFEFRLDTLLDVSRRKGVEHALCFLDLDQFKVVNDTCGHVVGDQLLRQVADRLRTHLRKSDGFARLGGDEFGILLDNCPLDRARNLAEELRQEIREFRFHWEGRSFDVRVSIGVIPITSASGGLSELMSAADSACYMAKDSGRDRVYVCAPDDMAVQDRQGEMQWTHRIRQALDHEGLVLACQDMRPLNHACAPAVVREFLLRMRTPDGQLVTPMVFLPAAERYNMMNEVDRWVVRRALETISEMERANREGTVRLYNINLSGQTLGDEAAAEFIGAAIREWGGDAARLCFEITETAAIANLARAGELMHSLKKLGCCFALDDFGSGLSSFGYLKRLPVDLLKIDGQFVRDMLRDPVDDAMVEAINRVGKVLGICTIAEFVEDGATLERLRTLGIDYAQGFFVERPWLTEPGEVAAGSPGVLQTEN